VGEALIAAEDGIRNWTDVAASELASRRRVQCDALDDVCAGPSMVIREVGFLSADRRIGQTISAVRLEPLDTASALFQNSFFGADVAAQWARRLQLAAHLAGNLPGYQLSMPGGLVPLDTAAAELFRRGSLRSL
jgi:hypothetical protein